MRPSIVSLIWQLFVLVQLAICQRCYICYSRHLFYESLKGHHDTCDINSIWNGRRNIIYDSESCITTRVNCVICAFDGWESWMIRALLLIFFPRFQVPSPETLWSYQNLRQQQQRQFKKEKKKGYLIINFINWLKSTPFGSNSFYLLIPVCFPSHETKCKSLSDNSTHHSNPYSLPFSEKSSLYDIRSRYFIFHFTRIISRIYCLHTQNQI